MKKEENELKIKENFSLAFKNHKDKNYNLAKNYYNKVLEINPNHFESIFLLGSLSVQNNNLLFFLHLAHLLLRLNRLKYLHLV